MKNIEAWLGDLLTHVAPDTPLVLVGNKIDLPNRVISKDEGEKAAKEVHAIHIETSAMTGENVRKLFEKLISLLVYHK